MSQPMNMASMLSSQIVSVGGRFASMSSLSEVREYVFKLATDLGAKQIAVSDPVLSSALLLDSTQTKPFEVASRDKMLREDFYRALETAEIGVTPVDLVIAETGTLILTTSDERDRLITALPKFHVAVLWESQMVHSLEESVSYIEQTLAKKTGVAISMISASSRTTDVGGILILGVHGPKELHVLLLTQESPRSA